MIWLLALIPLYFIVTGIIFVLDGYYRWFDNEPQVAFLWPFFLLFSPVLLALYLRDKTEAARKKLDQEAAKQEQIRISVEKELAALDAELEPPVIEPEPIKKKKRSSR